jgi:hypothetical protein
LSTVSAFWSTVDGSAIAGQDYLNRSGTVSFTPGSTTQTITVPIIGDSSDEWSPTLQMDEAFFVQLSSLNNANPLKTRATVTIIDDDRTTPTLPGLQLVSAVADGSPGSGRVRLQWRVPAYAAVARGGPTDVLVRWTIDSGSGCTAPTSDTGGTVAGEFRVWVDRLIDIEQPGTPQVIDHTGLPFAKHCYALFAEYTPGGTTTERAVISATPFDATAGPVAWAYSTGYTDILPPTVGAKAIYTVSTDGVVHAMERGLLGGAWPAGWNPVGLGKPAHNRSPVVPLPQGQRFFVGTEQGEVHAVDGENGAIAWSRSSRFGNTQLPYTIGYAQGTPAGVFTAFTGKNDVILVGTNQASANTFYMLNPVTGANVSTSSFGTMGGVPGMPVVDYDTNRMYFLSTSTAGTLWAFDMGIPGFPTLTLVSFPPVTYPVPFVSGAGGSPVLRRGRLYFGLTNGDMIPFRLSDGAGAATPLNVGDGQVKGFVFPDRRNNYIYFSTNSRVWGVKDTQDPTSPSLTPQWFVDIPSPSIVLHWTNTNYLYVGGGNGCLYQFDVSVPNPVTTKKSVRLDAGWQIGAPSLDGPNGLALVGSFPGVIYAVRVPLTTGDCP